MRWSGRTKRKDHWKEGLRAEGGTYCACVAGPLHRVHATDSQGRQASPESRRQVFVFCFLSLLSFTAPRTPRLALGFLQYDPIPTKWRSPCQRKGHPPQVSTRTPNTHSLPPSLTLQSSRAADLGERPLGAYVTIAKPPLGNRSAPTSVP